MGQDSRRYHVIRVYTVIHPAFYKQNNRHYNGRSKDKYDKKLRYLNI